MKRDFFRSVWFLVILAVIAPAGVQAKSNGMPAGDKHNAKAPIEVTSDALEVIQEQNKAIFTGHVVAIQGDVRLTADKMTVYYASHEDKTGDKKTAKKTAKEEKNTKKDTAATGAIKKIDADGSVFLATPLETASGASGTYDVEHQEIHLSDHVVLTREKNILKGDKLTYNFATGRSILSGGSDTANGKSKERVRALFVPENDKGSK